MTQIGVDQQHFGAVFGKGGRHVHGNSGLTFGRSDGGDDDHARIAAFNLRCEGKVGANTAEFLSDTAGRVRHDDRLVALQAFVGGDAAHDRRVDNVLQIAGFLHAGCHKIADQGGEHAENQACHQADGQVQCHLRGAGGDRLRSALHHGKLHRRLLAGGIQRLLHHIAQGFRHAVGNVGSLLRVSRFGGDVHERGVRRVRDGQLPGQIRDGGVEAKIVDNRLQHGFRGGQRRIRLNLVGDIRAGAVDVGNIVVLHRRITVGGEHLRGRGILRGCQECVCAHRCENHHERDDAHQKMLMDYTEQIHQGDAVVFRIIGFDDHLIGCWHVAFCCSHVSPRHLSHHIDQVPY